MKSECGWLNCLVGGIGFLFTVCRTYAWILDSQGRRNNFNFPQAVVFFCFDDDSGDAGVDRQIGHYPSPSGQVSWIVNCTEFSKQPIPFPDGIFKRRIKKRKFFRIAEIKGYHLQNDFGKIGAF